MLFLANLLRMSLYYIRDRIYFLSMDRSYGGYYLWIPLIRSLGVLVLLLVGSFLILHSLDIPIASSYSRFFWKNLGRIISERLKLFVAYCVLCLDGSQRSIRDRCVQGPALLRGKPELCKLAGLAALRSNGVSLPKKEFSSSEIAAMDSVSNPFRPLSIVTLRISVDVCLSCSKSQQGWFVPVCNCCVVLNQ